MFYIFALTSTHPPSLSFLCSPSESMFVVVLVCDNVCQVLLLVALVVMTMVE